MEKSSLAATGSFYKDTLNFIDVKPAMNASSTIPVMMTTSMAPSFSASEKVFVNSWKISS